MDVVFSVCIVTREAVCARVCEVWVFRNAYVVYVYHVEVLNTAFCMTCSLLMLVEDEDEVESLERGDQIYSHGWKVSGAEIKYGRGIRQSRSHDRIIGIYGCILLFTQSCYCECFYHL